MIVLLDTSDDLKQASEEIGLEVGQLMTPLTRFSDKGYKYAIDNGAFSCFDPTSFVSLLERQKASVARCLFVAVPDVVGSARRTLEAFDYWYPKLAGWPIALVAQDGIEDLPIPWQLLAAIFIGGSTKWKCSDAAIAVVKTGKLLGKWVHVGRVNTPERFDRFAALGVDSIDGTGISRYTHMRANLTEMSKGLFSAAAHVQS